MKYLLIVVLAFFSIHNFSNAQERGFVIERKELKDHIALVIGNSGYSDAPLSNPINDAIDVSRVFSEMGFIVDKVLDADKETMAQAIEQFSKKLSTAKAAVFYYAGHGVQVNGENYLIPIGSTSATQITDESQVPYRAINAGEVLSAMEHANVNFALVVLDACRNNPFKGSGRGRVPGLASINAPVGSLVMYATKAGSTASDGLNERNSPFTRAFLTHIVTPGLDVNLLPSKITQTVGELTGGSQVPGTYTQLKGSFTFVPELTSEEAKLIKEAELKNLKGIEAEIMRKEIEAAEKKRIDDESLAKKKSEIDALDKQIAELKQKTVTGIEGSAETDLDKMFEFVKQKEEQKRELETLQKQVEESRIAREKELNEMKVKEYNDKIIKINADINKYKQIASSEFGKDIAEAAWNNLLVKYGLSVGSVNQGDEYSFKEMVNPFPDRLDIGKVRIVGLDVITIKGGTFIMGSERGQNDETPHSITLSHFSIMRYEVSVFQFKQFIEVTGYRTDADKQTGGYGSLVWDGSKWKKQDGVNWKCGVGGNLRLTSEYSNPVIHISWNDAVAYSQWLSQKTGKKWRLPTEAEWEYAARGGQDYAYSGGEIIDELGWYNLNSSNVTHPVGQRKPNDYGLFDMTGNVWEWCSDWYGDTYYQISPINNPQGPLSGAGRVLRGGGWYDEPGICRVANRFANDPAYRGGNLGFRLVLEP
ncbi:MAG: SUMF1/EgtB/PvdO family nonheme iron enzyme [Bacteroidales bacterium]|nr:MAG: SUMF1/EgtB/PvdO family nonheme iron enzyme [Bacteroidales bacterium]